MTKKSPFRQIAFSFLLFLFLLMVLINLLSYLVQYAFPAIVEKDWFAWVLNYGVMYLLCFPIFLLCIRRVPDSYQEIPLPEPKKISIPAFLLIALCSYGIVQAINMGTNLITLIINFLSGFQVTNPLEQMITGSGIWINFLAVILIAPIMEELIFRKILYNKLIGYGPTTYILFSSLMFMFFHTNIYQMIYAFFLGMVLAALTAYTGNIKYNIALHMLINFLGSGIGMFVMAYGGQLGLIIFGLIVLALTLTGFTTALLMFFLFRKKFHLGYDQVLPLPEGKKVFLNAGVILMSVFYILVLLFSHLAPLFIS